MKTTWGVASATVVGLCGVASADVSISGHIDGTYNYNLTDPSGQLTPFHSYTAKKNTFLLNVAHVALTGSSDNVTYAVEVDAGTDAAINSSGYFPSLVDVQEAWVAYTHPENGLGLKAGKFVTYQGIEVVENTGNPTVSRGFLYGLAEPTTHLGAVGTYKINDSMDVAVGLVNGWDQLVDNNSLKTIVAKFGYTSESATVTASALAGPEQAGDNDDWRTTFDVTAVIPLSTVDLWIQANFGRETFMDGDADAMWFGAGVQPVVHFGDNFDLGARVEVFSDPDGARTGVPLAAFPDGVTLINVSAAPAYKLTSNLTLRGELRADIATEDVYLNRDEEATGMQLVGLTEVLYTFGS